jgi:ATP-dependent Zn protease
MARPRCSLVWFLLLGPTGFGIKGLGSRLVIRTICATWLILLQVKREREGKLIDLNSGVPWETVTLTTLARDRALFSSLLAEARDLALRGNEGRTVVYIARGIEWTQFGRPRRKREIGSVVLAEGVADRVMSDVKAFMERGKWYAERGEPSFSEYYDE